MDQEQRGWPSAAVAIAIIALIGAVTIKAIDEYEVGDTLQIWQAMDAIVGVVIGAVATYFFTRETVQNAQSQAKNAMQMAAQAERRANEAELAYARTSSVLTSQQREALAVDSGVRAALAPAGDAAGKAIVPG